MRIRERHGGPPVGDDILPPLPPEISALTDEGPMRRELLRQIAHLEEQLSRFTRDNTPFEPMPAVRRRGPAVLETASLEEIRDELLAVRQALHERVVDRVRDRLVEEDPAPPSRLARLWSRLRRTRS